jgi:hypothetical protein
MGSDSHPRILRLSPPVSRRIDYLHHSRIFRHILKKLHSTELLSWKKGFPFRNWVSHPSYTPFSGLHWKPACLVFP